MTNYMYVLFIQIYDADKMPTKKSGNYSSLDNNPIMRTLYDHIDVSLCLCVYVKGVYASVREYCMCMFL